MVSLDLVCFTQHWHSLERKGWFLSHAQHRVASVASLSNMQTAASAQAAPPLQHHTLSAMQQQQVRIPCPPLHADASAFRWTEIDRLCEGQNTSGFRT